MSLTKKDKEEIVSEVVKANEKWVKDIIEKRITEITKEVLIRASQSEDVASACKPSDYENEEDNEKCQSSKLEQLDKKWRENGIKSETTGLIIAPEDVEINGETRFTWGEAMVLEKEGKIPEGWRLPTRHEWALIAEEFGQDENGELRGYVLGSELNLKKDSGGDYYEYYWSSTTCSSDSYAYSLNLDTTYVNPQDDYCKYDDFRVRCVKSIDI